MVFALRNRCKINKIRLGDISDEHKDVGQRVVNCVIAGYNEEADYYRACLASFKNPAESPTTRIKHIFFIIDGLEADGQGYMRDIFRDIYPDGKIIVLEHNLNNLNYHSLPIIEDDDKHICIMQPHGGKREVLYSGFKLSINDTEVDAVMTSDSDTIIDTNAVVELNNMFNDTRIGSATGYVAIFNDESVISMMSRLRYFFASHMERAYESFTGNVLCMSGPLSIYRTEIVSEFLDEWMNQKFLGKACTYGDDRHLTNHILNRGYDTVFTHHAKCITETPTTITRFLRQQLRWNKSSAREMGWTMKFVPDRSVWMTLDITYQTLYSLFIFASIIYIVYAGTIDNIITYCYGLIIISVLRSLYGVIINGELKYLLYSFYSVIYLSLMIPLRIFALVKLTDTSWGTTGRKMSDNALGEWASVILWNLLIISGLVKKIIEEVDDITSLQLYMLISIPSYFMSLYLIVAIYSRFKKHIYQKYPPLSNYLGLNVPELHQMYDIDTPTGIQTSYV